MVVDSSGRGIKGIHVRGRLGSPYHSTDTRTDEDGRFVLSGFSKGKVKISISFSGYFGESEKTVSAGDENVVFELNAYGKITGRLVGMEKFEYFDIRAFPEDIEKPVPMNRFSSNEDRREYRKAYDKYNRRRYNHSFHGNEGKFTMSILPGTYTLRASGKGFTGGETYGVVAVSGGATEDIVINVSRGCRLSVKVLAKKDRSPVKGAHVHLKWKPPDGRASNTSGGTHYTNMQARTDNKGVVTFEGLGPGAYYIKVAHKSYAVSYAGVVEVTAGSAKEIEVSLSAGSRITGLIRGPDGAPAVNVRINGYRQETAYSPWSDSVSAYTDKDGKYAIPFCSEGTYCIYVYRMQSGRHGCWSKCRGRFGNSNTIEVPAGGEAVFDFNISERR
jgi:5-hydroxyisourate hydrolase-like protein (transthyretin family)